MDYRLNSVLTSLPSSAITDVKRMAKDYEARGIDVIHLERGEPDFTTPRHIIDAITAAMQNGATHYPALQGENILRKAIVEKLARENRIQTGMENIFVGAGGTHCLYCLMQTLINPGDEVLVPTPYWHAVSKLVTLAGGTPVLVPFFMEVHEKKLDEEQAVKLLADAVTPKTKLLYFNSPNNPTGVTLGRSHIEAIAEFAKAKDLFVIADEAYEHMVYNDEGHTPIGSLSGMAERTASVFTFSKSYAMTGFRLGYGVLPESVSKQVWSKAVLYTSMGVPTAIQRGAAVALTGPQEPVHEMVDAYGRRLKLLVNGLQTLDGFEVEPPTGAMYVFAKVAQRRNGRDLMEVIKDFLQKGVAVAPGNAFGDEYQDYVRVCYAASDEQLAKAVRRLALEDVPSVS